MQDLHLDQHIRINNHRHAGIVLKDGKILLMRRIKDGEEYWVVPGGHLQKGEDPLKTVIREIKEETSIIVENPKLVFEFKDYKNDNYDYYYICEYVSGNLELGGEEKMKNSPENFYEPHWVDVGEIKNLLIFPVFAKEWMVDNL